MTRKRTAILISGRGSNMEALLAAAADRKYPAEPVLILANRPDAIGLETARAAGVATAMIDHKAYESREAFETEIDKALNDAGVELVALAGFMRVLTPWLVEKWAGRMINIHPSLLPNFPGLKTHQRAIDAGVKLHGCTVHYVTSGVDEGPAIGQAAVCVKADDTPETLASRVLEAEHFLYPQCLAGVASGAKNWEGRMVSGRSGAILLNAPI